MSSHKNHDSTAYSITEVSVILGVPRSWVAKGVRQGWIRTVRRRGRLVIPAHVVVRLLGDGPATSGDAR